MAEFMWSDFLLALIAVVLAVLLATGYPSERKVKPKKVKRDFKAEWESL
jgi:ABC-type lipoprotein release transport system permease subunit